MKMFLLSLTLLIVSMVKNVHGDYDCVCNYAVEKAIYPAPDVNAQPFGFLYEFDCKPTINEKDSVNGQDFFGIQYEKQAGYITKSQDVQIQICPGALPDADLIPTTVKQTSIKQSTTTPPTSTKTSTTTPITTTTPTTTSATTTTYTTTPMTTLTTTSTTTTTPTTTFTTTPTSSTTTPTTTHTTTTTPTTTPTTTLTTTSTTTSMPTTTFTTTPTTSPTPTTITTTLTTTTTTTRPTTRRTTTTKRPTTKAPLTWPTGTYGLMQTAQGCPAGNTRWVTGWRKQDTEDEDAHNYFTSGIQHYLGGEFKSNNLVTRFCIKDTTWSSAHDKPWPRGSYCILKHRACPSGFRSGFIHWDDEDSSNSNSRGGALPDGEYNQNTEIDYCCRGDSSPGSEISLPTERPFILLRFSNTCQSVRDMNVREVYVRWDDEDTFNSSGKGGWHPADDGGSKDHLLYFCYYHPLAGPSLIG